MLLFSATYDSQVMKFAETVVPSPVTIRLRREEESLDNIRQVFLTRHQHAEELVLISLYKFLLWLLQITLLLRS